MKYVFIMSLLLINATFDRLNPTERSSKVSNTSITKAIVKVLNYEELKSIINKNDNKLYVVNFWATWCRPCVEELPDFMEVNRKYNTNPRFKMILVSMDMASEIETSVKPFLQKNKMDVETYLLDDNKRMNEWIPAVDKSWSGAIPATVFYRNGKKLEFFESRMPKIELEKIINKYI